MVSLLYMLIADVILLCTQITDIISLLYTMMPDILSLRKQYIKRSKSTAEREKEVAFVF
jgi:hypothetical protein